MVKKSKRKVVYIGLSGGVDSSVSALLLKNQGHDVRGVFIKVWQPDWIKCNWKEDRRDAMRICARLNIPFYTLNLENEYKHDVIDYMIAEYTKGNTPNPDVMCNKYIKFGAFYNWAKKNEGDYIATGHYAQIINNKLLCGIDKDKDQSYFLWNIKREQLKHILFPVGELRKREVRKIAKDNNFINHAKKDSQGLCFIGKLDFKDFLKRYVPNKSGDVLDLAGNVIGRHPGSIFFTIGERHGFEIFKKSSDQRPLFIVSKDVKRNAITVSSDVDEGKSNISHENTISTKETNWISRTQAKVGDKFLARARYRQDFFGVKLDKIINNKMFFSYNTDLLMASGQSLVIYRDKECMGGGIIE